ncbi:MAG: type II toxin-antitoxin system PemK/MazF family toxin [bacterium]
MKDFSNWNSKKIQIHNFSSSKLYKERDIWWCSLGVNIGYEQDGKDFGFQRPVLIVKGLSSKTCLIAPLTSSDNSHVLRISIGIIKGRASKVIISQIKVIDTKRLINKIAVLDAERFEMIRKSIKEIL